jgi:hypothetical protein
MPEQERLFLAPTRELAERRAISQESFPSHVRASPCTVGL